MHCNAWDAHVLAYDRTYRLRVTGPKAVDEEARCSSTVYEVPTTCGNSSTTGNLCAHSGSSCLPQRNTLIHTRFFTRRTGGIFRTCGYVAVCEALTEVARATLVCGRWSHRAWLIMRTRCYHWFSLQRVARERVPAGTDWQMCAHYTANPLSNCVHLGCGSRLRARLVKSEFPFHAKIKLFDRSFCLYYKNCRAIFTYILNSNCCQISTK